MVTRGPRYTVFERADSNRIYQYVKNDSSEVIVCDFNAAIGDSIGGYRVSDKFLHEAWGETRRYLRLSRSSWLSFGGITYAEGIGQVSSWSDGHGYYYETELVGAVLDGVVYGDTIWTGVEDSRPNESPLSARLFQNYPNPFNGETVIRFQLMRDFPERVRLQIYDMAGREVSTLVDQQLRAGEHQVSWNGTDNSGKVVNSGVYFYRLRAGSFSQTKKFTLLH